MGDFSGMIPEPNGTTALSTNPEYVKLFGAGSLVVGVAHSIPAQTDQR